MAHYTIRQSDISGDEGKIAALLQRNFPGLPGGRYDWIYRKNIAGEASCWIAETENREGIGCAVLFARTLFIDGCPAGAGIAGDFSVDHPHRSLGLALSLQTRLLAACRSGAPRLVYGMPNSKSEAVLKRAGFSVLGNIITMTRPLKSGDYLAKRIKNQWLLSAASNILDVLLRTGPELLYGRDRQTVLEWPARFDERFDIFWNSVKNRYFAIGDRSSAYLRWRYQETPHGQYQVAALTNRRKNEIHGYIVFTIEKQRVSIADILCRDPGKTLNSMLAKFIEAMKSRGAAAVSVSFLEREDLIKSFGRFQFRKRTNAQRLLLFVPPHDPSYARLMQKENWYFFPGDNDI